MAFSAQWTDPRDTMTRDEVLTKWQSIKEQLAQLKEQEMDWRKYVVHKAFEKPVEGTNTLELGNGYNLKAVVKNNYKLLENDKVEATLDKISKIGNEGSFIADRLVSWTPSFLLTEYRKLQEDSDKGNQTAKQILALVTEMLEITEAAPTVDIKEPRKKK